MKKIIVLLVLFIFSILEIDDDVSGYDMPFFYLLDGDSAGYSCDWVFPFINKTNSNVKFEEIQSIREAVDMYHKNSRLSAEDFISIMAEESRFKHESVSGTGDHGIMQINKFTYRRLCKIGKFECEWNRIGDIKYNVFIASKVLEYHGDIIISKYGNLDYDMFKSYLIGSYNAGFRFDERSKAYAKRVNRFSRRISYCNNSGLEL